MRKFSPQFPRRSECSYHGEGGGGRRGFGAEAAGGLGCHSCLGLLLTSLWARS